MKKNNDNSVQIDGIIQALSNRLGIDSSLIKRNLNGSNLESITKNLNKNEKEKIQELINNPDAAKQILASKETQDFLKQFNK